MTFFQRSRRWLTAIALVLLLTVSTTACSSATTEAPATNVSYSQLERGNSTAGQAYGDWVVGAAQGLISDAYVRDNNKLGVVITDAVNPDEVRGLSKSLLQGFRQSFPNQDLKVIVFAPDKAPILEANYDSATKEVEYEVP